MQTMQTPRMDSKNHDQAYSNSASMLCPEDLSTSKDTDQAYEFLTKVHVSVESANDVNPDALRHKIDWHIVPVMFCCYTMQFLDKVSLNVCEYNSSKHALAC